MTRQHSDLTSPDPPPSLGTHKHPFACRAASEMKLTGTSPQLRSRRIVYMGFKLLPSTKKRVRSSSRPTDKRSAGGALTLTLPPPTTKCMSVNPKRTCLTRPKTPPSPYQQMAQSMGRGGPWARRRRAASKVAVVPLSALPSSWFRVRRFTSTRRENSVKRLPRAQSEQRRAGQEGGLLDWSLREGSWEGGSSHGHWRGAPFETSDSSRSPLLLR